MTLGLLARYQRRRAAADERRLLGALRRAEDDHADNEHNLRKWGFGMTPSRRRRAEEEIERSRAHLDALRAEKERRGL